MGPLTESPAWQDLLRHQKEICAHPLSEMLLTNPERLQQCTLSLDGLRLSYAFQNVVAKTIDLLAQLAVQQKVEAWREKLFSGDQINTSEHRPALHTALRQKNGAPLLIDGRDIRKDITSARQQMTDFVASVRTGARKGATGKPLRSVVNIGIGGSDLGPRLAVEALAPLASKLDVHFVANVDAFDLLQVLKKCNPAETLFVVVSKTFSTEETLLNAETAKKWLAEQLGGKALAHHFVAVTAHKTAAEKFGMAPEMIFPLWDWVGGRFSLWSCVGLSVALALGMDHFSRMLDGASAMDEHFLGTPLKQNMPVMLALLSVWQRNFYQRKALAVLPYSERLRNLPRYLQQLEMESGGKSVTRNGDPVECATSPLLFGDCGTVGQHSFYQWLHQGSDPIPADFIGVLEDDLGYPLHHRALLTNMLAQVGALAFGQQIGATAQDIYEGNRPSTLILLDKLDPYHFGLLLALYEHKIFVEGSIWGINIFDQPGVELGKRMARDLELQTGSPNPKSTFLRSFLATMGLKSRQ